MKFECISCKYKFVPKTERVPKRCPFCSSPELREAESAQDLLDSVTGDRLIPL